MDTFTLKDVVAAAGLNLSTAQYVLKHPEYVPEMPEAGSQGIHRQFTYEQAFRLAFCATLVAGGIRLEAAARVVHYSLAKVRRHYRQSHSAVVPFELGEEWSLKICNGEYFALSSEDGLQVPQEGWASIDDLTTIKSVSPPVFHFGLNLSLLQGRLEKLRLSKRPPK